ncbi:zinc finger protein CONSTANS-LIKE 3-like [Rutidosis leptorrhynchoides]|uniref:zinc finger protein CONSTANS-LIKE 3-like n=1 Tax=Rutidosis leptorrhynchoides TaxID=125765 RepID=UPI003A99B8CE
MVENSGGICNLINAAPKLCDICKLTAALLFCRKDIVYLCMTCDVKLHSHTKHERVWMCELCEQSPARVTCKADAAVLCVTCDRYIHSANPLARRHERMPVVPFYNSAAEAVVSCMSSNVIEVTGTTELNNSVEIEIPSVSAVNSDNFNLMEVSGTTELSSSVEIPLVTTSIDAPVVMKSLDLLSVADPFFDFGFAIPTDVSLENRLHDSVNDGVVPIRTTVPPIDLITSTVTNSYKSQSHSELSSSIDAGVAPEENSSILPVNGGTKGKKLCAVDREARVLRYKEKRKNRKFEKKVRYASRKAYAEMRPRVKGRFIKRTQLTADVDMDPWLLTTDGGGDCYVGDVGYGVVPSF